MKTDQGEIAKDASLVSAKALFEVLLTLIV
jgi:hypothetical protein